MSWRFLQVGCAVSGLVLACGGATKQTLEQPTGGASAGGAGSGAPNTSGTNSGGTLASAGTTETSAGNSGSASLAGNAAAGAAPIGDLNCFTPDELPPDWYAGGAAGAASSECPVAPEPSFGFSYCYFWLADVAPGPTPPEHAGKCCYFLSRLYCR